MDNRNYINFKTLDTPDTYLYSLTFYVETDMDTFVQSLHNTKNFLVSLLNNKAEIFKSVYTLIKNNGDTFDEIEFDGKYSILASAGLCWALIANNVQMVYGLSACIMRAYQIQKGGKINNLYPIERSEVEYHISKSELTIWLNDKRWDLVKFIIAEHERLINHFEALS